jgi:hypothetical protein
LSSASPSVAAGAVEPGSYTAFGLRILGPHRYLRGHCAELPPAHADTADLSELRIEVLHGKPVADPRWRCLLRPDAERAARDGRHFRALHESADGLWRRFELIGNLVVDAAPGLGRLRVHAPALMHPDTLGAFITGTAMLCYFKAMGSLCVHAAAVAKGPACVLLCGPSGAGKSSLAAAMHGLGWRVVVEDLAVLARVDQHVQVLPGYGRIRLWPESLAGLGTDQAQRIAVGADKHYLTLADAPVTSHRLTRLVSLAARSSALPGAVSCAPLPSVQALVALHGNTLAPYLDLPQEARRLLAVSRQIASELPAFELRLADDWSRMAQAARILDRLWCADAALAPATVAREHG